MARRQTKIVATVGPACRDEETLAGLIEAGVDGFRIDLADPDVGPGDQASLIGRIRRLAETDGRQLTVLADLPPRRAISRHHGLGDLDWVDFAVAQGVDLLSVPFVGSEADLARVAARLDDHRSDLPLVARIERRSAVRGIDRILDAADGIVIPRSELAQEVESTEVPVIQKRLIRAAGRHSKVSLTMNQMLGSMVAATRPTRAEATDVANAIYDGADALVLCEETAIGAHPIEAVRVMDNIARATEPDLPRADWLASRTGRVHADVADAVAHGAVGASYRLSLKALVVPTASGRTARLVAAHRPAVPVLALSPRIRTVRRLGLLAGVTAALGGEAEDTSDLLEESARLACRCGVAASGDLVGITGALHGHGLGTNLFGVHRVP
ncbi:MAG: hypothetical protein JST59_09855 [Actinobacteria bacterium]|nr:hypothetical protein [Actinomycetota bacterium]